MEIDQVFCLGQIRHHLWLYPVHQRLHHDHFCLVVFCIQLESQWQLVVRHILRNK